MNDQLVGDGFRQAILGHKNGTIVNRHYTAQKAALLKDCLERADSSRSRSPSPTRMGFPVITGCLLGGAEEYVAELTLDDAGEAELITIFAHGSSVPCFESRRTRRRGGDEVETCAMPALSPAEIGSRINQIVGKGLLRAPTAVRKRQLVEHFRALAWMSIHPREGAASLGADAPTSRQERIVSAGRGGQFLWA